MQQVIIIYKKLGAVIRQIQFFYKFAFIQTYKKKMQL